MMTAPPTRMDVSIIASIDTTIITAFKTIVRQNHSQIIS